MANQLPKLHDFVKLHLKLAEPRNAIFKETCSICQEPLLDADHVVPIEEKLEVLGVPACEHLFQRECIYQFLESTIFNGNECPNCRKPMCKLNVLPRIIEAGQSAEEYEDLNPGQNFVRVGYVWILHKTDQFFRQEYLQWRPLEQESYILVIGNVRAA